MIKVYVMESCPDCTQVKQLYKDNKEDCKMVKIAIFVSDKKK